MTGESFTYHLACHCQAHIIELTAPADTPFPEGGVCDCSHCLKRRIVWGVAPKGSLKVLRGVGKNGVILNEYKFASKSSGHQFCAKCGTHLLGAPFVENAGSYMCNLRAIRDDNFDLWKLKLRKYHGIDRLPPYVHPTLEDVQGAVKYLDQIAPNVDGRLKTYVGACHCQAVKFAVRSEPLESVSICDCACSICLGNGVLWLYPRKQNVFFSPALSASIPHLPATEMMNKYTFGDASNGHYICKTCGCEVYEARVPEDPHGGSFGLNIALLTEIGEYFNDAQGMNEHGQQLQAGGGSVMRGLDRDTWAKSRPPLYSLKL